MDAPGAVGSRSDTRLMGLLTFGWKALAPSACGCDLTCKRGVCPGQVTRRLLRWPLVQYDCVLIKKRKFGRGDRKHTGGAPCHHDGCTRGVPALHGASPPYSPEAEGQLRAHGGDSPRSPVQPFEPQGPQPARPTCGLPSLPREGLWGLSRPARSQARADRRSLHPGISPHL